MKIAVLSPHHGDAAFALALSIGEWIEAGHKVQVVNCFSRSEQAPFAEMDFVHSNDRMSFVTALRSREDEIWRRKYGSALSLSDLNMKDAARRLHKRADELFGLAVDPADKAIEKIQKALERIEADALALPLALGGHIDHLLVREASAASARAVLPCAFYEDLPYAAGLEAPESIESVVQELAQSLNTELAATSASAAGDVGDAVARKRKMALCFDSQIDDETVERIAQFCVRYDGRERLWANPAWIDAGPRLEG